jgi:hypothetical protein
MNPDVLLAGLVGALSVLAFGVAREKWRGARELLGLLGSVLAEIEHNKEVLDIIRPTNPSLIGSPDLSRTKTETWRGVRVRVTQLATKELTETLNSYYSSIDVLVTLMSFDSAKSEYMERWLRGVIQRDLGRDVPRSRNPFTEYADLTFNRQDEARDLINWYFAQPLFWRWFWT